METAIEKNNSAKHSAGINVNLSETERIISGVAGGGLLLYGLKRGDLTGAALAVAGGLLGVRGATGHCQIKEALDSDDRKAAVKSWFSGTIHITKAVTINKSQAELYSFWRNFENLPKFMNHLESVTVKDEKISHWIAKAPLGTAVEWNAELTSDRENERIGWKSVAGADIVNSGVVEFKPTNNRGTEVVVHLTYEAPAGTLGALAAKIFGEEPAQQVAEDLRRFKRLMETGLIMSVEGQSSGREKDKAQSAAA